MDINVHESVWCPQIRLPLAAIPHYEFQKINANLIANTSFQYQPPASNATYLFATDAEDSAENKSIKSNIVENE